MTYAMGLPYVTDVGSAPSWCRENSRRMEFLTHMQTSDLLCHGPVTYNWINYNIF